MQSLGKAVRTALDGLYLLAGWLAGLFLIAIFVLMMMLSVGREIRFNIPAGDDFVSWCMAAMALLTAVSSGSSAGKPRLRIRLWSRTR